MDSTEPNSPGLMATLRRVGSTLLQTFQNRVELLVVELQEERLRLFNALLLGAIMVGLGFLGVALLTFALVIFLWKFYGIAGLVILGAIDLIVAALIFNRLRQTVKNWSFLSGTLDELKKDCECLENKN